MEASWEGRGGATLHFIHPCLWMSLLLPPVRPRRKLRSEYSGNAKAAVELLQRALRDAQGSTERNPEWLRGYERAATAAEALGGEHIPAQLKALSAIMAFFQKTENLTIEAKKKGLPVPLPRWVVLMLLLSILSSCSLASCLLFLTSPDTPHF